MFTVRRACRFWLNLRYKGSFQPLRVEVAARVPWFRRITRCLEEVLEGLGHGDTVLVHCKAGKHRSGAFSALVLACLTGVSWDTAAEDLFRIRKYNDKDRIIVEGIGKDLKLRDVADEFRCSEFWRSIEYMFAASIERRRIQRLAGRAGAHVPPREKRQPVADKPLTSSSSTVVLELMSKKMPSNKQQPQPLPTPPPPPRRRTEKRAASMSPPRGPPQKRPLRSPERPPLRREGFDEAVLIRATPPPPEKLTTAPAKPSSGVPSSLVLKHTTTPKSKSSGVPVVLRPPPVEAAKSKSSGVPVVLRPPPVDKPVVNQDSDDSEDEDTDSDSQGSLRFRKRVPRLTARRDRVARSPSGSPSDRRPRSPSPAADVPPGGCWQCSKCCSLNPGGALYCMRSTCQQRRALVQV